MQITREFKLSQITQRGVVPIRLVIRWPGTRIYHPTGFSLSPENWDFQKRQPKGKDKSSQLIKQHLNEIEYRIQQLYAEMHQPGLIFNIEEFKRKLNAQPDENYQEPTYQLEDIIEKYQTLNAHSYVPEHLMAYRQMLHNIRKAKLKEDIRDIDPNYLQAFEAAQVKSGLANGTINKNLTRLKVILKFSYQQGLIKKIPSYRSQLNDESSHKHYLTIEELNKLIKVELSETLQPYRDMFVFACFTGLRFSDLSTLTSSHIQIENNQYIIKKSQVKTKNQVTIVLLKPAVEIYLRLCKQSKTEYIFKGISTQKYNFYLKKISKLAGIDSQVTVVKYTGTQAKEQVQAKHETVSSHTARHTFAVLSLLQGMKIEVLQKILGHKSINSTQVYAQLADEEKHKQMLNVWSSFVSTSSPN